MATKKKAAESSKTAHVMNLISKHSPSASPAPADDPAGTPAEEVSAPLSPNAEVPPAAPESGAPQAPAHPQQAPIIVSLASEAAVSEQIKEALEEALESEAPIPEEALPPELAQTELISGGKTEQTSEEVEPMEEEKTVEETESTQAAQPVEDAQPAMEVEETVQPEADAQPVPSEPAEDLAEPAQNDTSAEEAPLEEVPLEEAPADAAEEAVAPVQPQDTPNADENIAAPVVHETHCVNVMERLVDESMGKYMDMFGMCTCSKCASDVKALALDNLPPKYVVMEDREIGPRTTVYEGRFRTAVTAQILRACETVMAQPRHDQ